MMNFYLLANAAVKLAYPAFTHNDYAIRYPHSEDLSHTVTNHTKPPDRIRFGFKSALRNAVPTTKPSSNVRNVFTNTTLNTTPSVIAQLKELAPVFTSGPALTRSQLRQQLAPFLSQLHTTRSSNTWASNVRSVLLNARRTTRSSALTEVHKLALAFTSGPAWTGGQLRSQLAPFMSQRYLSRSQHLNPCWTLNPAPGIKGYIHCPRPGHLTFGVPFVLTQGVVGLRTVMQRISSVFQIDNYRYIMEMASRTLRIESGLSPAGRMTMTMSEFLNYARANAKVLKEVDVKIVPDLITTTASETNDAPIKLPCLTLLKIECMASDKRFKALVMNNLRQLEITISGQQPICAKDFLLQWEGLNHVILRCNTTALDFLQLLALLKRDVHVEWEGSLTDFMVSERMAQYYIAVLNADTVHIRCREDFDSAEEHLEQLLGILKHSEKVRRVTLNGQAQIPPSPEI